MVTERQPLQPNGQPSMGNQSINCQARAELERPLMASLASMQGNRMNGMVGGWATAAPAQGSDAQTLSLLRHGAEAGMPLKLALTAA